MAAAENSRILRVGSNTPARRFRSSLSFPPPPKPSPLGFHRAHLSLRDQKTNENYECGARAMPRTQAEMRWLLAQEISATNQPQQIDFAL
jgi:hypothetical protein